VRGLKKELQTSFSLKFELCIINCTTFSYQCIATLIIFDTVFLINKKANMLHFHCQQWVFLGSPSKNGHKCLVCENIINLITHNQTELFRLHDTDNLIENHPTSFHLLEDSLTYWFWNTWYMNWKMNNCIFTFSFTAGLEDKRW